MNKKALRATNAAIDLLGGTVAVAKLLGVNHYNVSRYRKEGVSYKHAAKLAHLAGVEPEVLRPDLFQVRD